MLLVRCTEDVIRRLGNYPVKGLNLLKPNPFNNQTPKQTYLTDCTPSKIMALFTHNSYSS